MSMCSHKNASITRGLGYYYVTSLVVLLSVMFTDAFVVGAGRALVGANVVQRMCGGNGYWYRETIDKGYWYQPDTECTIPYFPAYPLIAGWLKEIAGIRTEVALLLVAQVCLAATFIVFASYIEAPGPGGGHEQLNWTLLAMGLWPTTMFLRMAHSETLFVLLTALTLYGIRREWPSLLVAIIVGVATATRPVGVALVPVVVLAAWRRRVNDRAVVAAQDESKGSDPRSGALCRRRCVAHCAAVAVVSCWGLIAFVIYQASAFREPLAFAKAQVFWRLRIGEDVSILRKAAAEVTLEPIWEAYLPSRENYWAKHDRHGHALFSLQFANPISFLATVALVIIGWRKKWLNDYELLLSAGLLLVPYVIKSHDNAMASFGRFSAVVLPAYIVMGNLLARLPAPISAVIMCVSTFFLVTYSALFAAGYRFI